MTLNAIMEAAVPTPARRVIGCWMTAFGFAMRCKLGEVDDALMQRLTSMVALALDEDDPVRVAIKNMARQWPHLRRPHQTEALQTAGEELLRAVERSTWPSASGRADLDG